MGLAHGAGIVAGGLVAQGAGGKEHQHDLIQAKVQGALGPEVPHHVGHNDQRGDDSQRGKVIQLLSEVHVLPAFSRMGLFLGLFPGGVGIQHSLLNLDAFALPGTDQGVCNQAGDQHQDRDDQVPGAVQCGSGGDDIAYDLIDDAALSSDLQRNGGGGPRMMLPAWQAAIRTA